VGVLALSFIPQAALHPRVMRRTPGERHTIISSAALRSDVPVAFVTVVATPHGSDAAGIQLVCNDPQGRCAGRP
jgi:hypothetical protein